MGRRVAEATNAWRIRRTRGDITRRRRRACVPDFFLAAVLFAAFDFELEGLFEGDEFPAG